MAKLFHGALGQDGQVTNAVTSEMVQQRIQDEMCAALNRQSLGTTLIFCLLVSTDLLY